MTEEPCETFFGNTCSGFGGSTHCLICGWDKWDHSPYKERAEKFANTLRESGRADGGA